MAAALSLVAFWSSSTASEPTQAKSEHSETSFLGPELFAEDEVTSFRLSVNGSVAVRVLEGARRAPKMLDEVRLDRPAARVTGRILGSLRVSVELEWKSSPFPFVGSNGYRIWGLTVRLVLRQQESGGSGILMLDELALSNVWINTDYLPFIQLWLCPAADDNPACHCSPALKFPLGNTTAVCNSSSEDTFLSGPLDFYLKSDHAANGDANGDDVNKQRRRALFLGLSLPRMSLRAVSKVVCPIVRP